MNTFQVKDQVGEIMTRCPSLSKVFDETGIDYCCGGKQTLEAACEEKGIDSQAMLAMLEETSAIPTSKSVIDTANMSLTEQVDHIEQTHHAYLRDEFPRIDQLTKKVESVHGEKEPRLFQVRETFHELVTELLIHMMKEERVLFPMIRELETEDDGQLIHCGSISIPIRQMESEHRQAGSNLEKLRLLTDNYTPPDWACITYQEMLSALAHLEHDLHLHIHKENNILFPRVILLEQSKQF